MKPSINHRFSILIISFFLGGYSFSQSSNLLDWQTPKFPIPAFREDSKGHKTFTPPIVSSEALNAFTDMFKGASNVRWFELDNKFLAKFNKEGRETNALFNKNGRHIYTISYGLQKHLPLDIREKITHVYFNYLITLVVEVNSLGDTAWIVRLEDEKRMIIVKVADDEMEETENYAKSK